MEALVEELPDDIRVRSITLPHISAGLIPRLKNIWFVRSIKADIVHVNGDVQYAILGSQRSKALLTILDLTSLHRLSGTRRALLRLFWYTLPAAWSKEITVISSQTGQELVALEPRCESKVHVVHIAINSRFFEPKATQPSVYRNFLQVGTSDNKNLDRVIQAFANEDWVLHVVGAMTDQQTSKAEELGVCLRNYVNLSDNELLELYRSTDALIFASTYEGFGMPIVEAQAIGLPVITSGIAPMTEVAGQAALFVDPLSIEELRDACRRISDDAELGLMLVQQGHRNAEQFKPSVVAKSYADCYRRMAQGSEH